MMFNSLFRMFFVFCFPFRRISLVFGNNALNLVHINSSPVYIELFKDTRITILQALDYLKIKVPRFCYHEALNVAGNCRMCLVELQNSIKPVIACSTLLSPNMEIYTDSHMVRDIRKGVLEFLLINHPLDCPVCDQAGKCDLQDLAFLFGQDVTRFNIKKRGVSDIFFNSYVKTVMVRCIHCTRCTRFLSDVLFVEGLGMMGRGNNSIISTYASRNLDHSLVSNVIDLCPVGALISKVNASTYRSWEKESSYFLDLFDPFLKSVSVELCGNKVVDILPIVGDINSFITERTRYLWQSFQSFRVSSPHVSIHASVYYFSVYSVLLQFFSYFFCSGFSSFSSFCFDFLNLKDAFFISFIFSNFLNLSEFNNNNINLSLDHRFFIMGFHHSMSSVICGIDLNEQAPLMVTFFNRNYDCFYNNYLFLNPPKNLYNPTVYSSHSKKHIGSHINSHSKFLEGRLCLHSLSFANNRTSPIPSFNFVLSYEFTNFINYSFFTSSLRNVYLIRTFGNLHKEEVGHSFSFSSYSSFVYSKRFVLIKFYTNIKPLTTKFNSVFNFDIHSNVESLKGLNVDIGLYSPFERPGKYINIQGNIKNISANYFSSSSDKDLIIPPLFVKFFAKFVSSNFYSVYNTMYSSNIFNDFDTYYLDMIISNSFLFRVSFPIYRFSFSPFGGSGFFFFFCNFFSFFINKFLYCFSRRIFNSFFFYLNYRSRFFFTPYSYRFGNVDVLECDVFSPWALSLRVAGAPNNLKNEGVSSFLFNFNNIF